MFIGCFAPGLFAGGLTAFTRALMTGMAVPDAPPHPRGYRRWMPGDRPGQLAMGRKWEAILAVRGTAWGVPGSESDKLTARCDIAESALARTKDPNGFTHSETTACELAFVNLRAHMRDLKDRYFKIPPLTEEEMASLGLHQRRPASAVPDPAGIPTIEIEHSGPNQVRLLVTHLPGSPVDRDGVVFTRELHYELVDFTETALSLNPDEFSHTVVDKNKYITLKLPVGSIGRRLRVAGRYLNEHGGKGQWSVVTEGVVS